MTSSEIGPEVLPEPVVARQPASADPEVLATYGADTEFAHLLDPAVEWPRHDLHPPVGFWSAWFQPNPPEKGRTQ